MIERYSTKGKKYTLHIRDATSAGGKNLINWSENELDESIGVPVLMGDALTVDELVELIKSRNE